MATRRGAAHEANIMDALSASRRPLSAYALLDQLRPTGVAAPLTVYRALDNLMKSGKVHRIETLNAFVACRQGHHHGHHGEPAHQPIAFTICDECGAVDEFADPGLRDRLSERLVSKGFVPTGITLEVRGLCAVCSAKA